MATIDDMTTELVSRGEFFAGLNPADIADEWLGYDFTSTSASKWLDISVWDAATAAALRDAGLSPDRVKATAERLAAEDADRYTDGCPIYAACNGDYSVDNLIAACMAK